jgi:hypothetical protein
MIQIAAILEECSEANWDGYHARPINRSSVQHACQFLEKLPPDIAAPELTPEPTGILTMVWRKEGYHLIVGINADNQIAWGGTSPEGNVYGEASFGLGIPEELINLLRKVEGRQ